MQRKEMEGKKINKATSINIRWVTQAHTGTTQCKDTGVRLIRLQMWLLIEYPRPSVSAPEYSGIIKL